MAERVFCIDFGSGYTKVGLRTAANADALLLASPSVAAGGVDFCVPSVVVADQRGGKRKYDFGYEALGRKAGDGIRVFSNWKRWAFEAGKSVPTGWEPLLTSEEFAALAGRFHVPLPQVRNLQQLVRAAQGLGGVTPPAESLEVQWAKVLAEKFFGFLREFVLETCRKRPDVPAGIEDVPAVLAVPAFAPEAQLAAHPGVQLLTSALTKAGWKLRGTGAVVSEPFANAVGVLTGGANALRTTPAKGSRPRATRIDLGKMFKKGPILTAANDGQHYPLYRALVVDIGAYTTDVAVVELPAAEADDFDAAAVRVRQQSVSLGVRDIDERVAAVLPSKQAEHLRERMSAAEWEDFRQRVYTDERPFRTQEGNIGTAADRGPIRDTLERFGQEVGEVVTAFCGPLPPANMQELILTGGGSHIPAVRSVVVQAVKLPGSPVVRVLSPTRRALLTNAVARHLDERSSRGGTALGGCSIFFEVQYF